MGFDGQSHISNLLVKEIIMAKKERLAISAGDARESAMLRSLRIDGSCNGQTLRTRVIKNKKLYNRNLKHKKSFAHAEDFPFFSNFFLTVLFFSPIYWMKWEIFFIARKNKFLKKIENCHFMTSNFC